MEKKNFSLPPLYKLDQKQKKRFWIISFDGENIVSRWGAVDGKELTSATEVKVNNSNRSLYDQAFLQASQKHKLKISKEGYTPNADVGDGDDGEEEKVVRPQLAGVWNKEKHSPPFMVQPKLDGMRCLTTLKEGKVVLISRQGKEFSHITHLDKECKELLDKFPPGSYLDGELYIHGNSFQHLCEIAKGTKNKHALQDTLNYHIYDVIIGDNTEESFLQRYIFLLNKYAEGKYKFLQLVNTEVADDEEELDKHHAKSLEDGYEGTILRKIYAPYKCGGRLNMFKRKDFMDEEVTVTDIFEGKGTEKEAAVYTCEDDEGLSFNVRPRGTIEERKKIFHNKAEYIGRKLTIRYQEKTNKGIPRFPVGIAFRNEEDLPSK